MCNIYLIQEAILDQLQQTLMLGSILLVLGIPGLMLVCLEQIEESNLGLWGNLSLIPLKEACILESTLKECRAFTTHNHLKVISLKKEFPGSDLETSWTKLNKTFQITNSLNKINKVVL